MACWNEVKQCDPEETQYVKLQETQLIYTLHRFILDGMTGEISTSPVAISKPRRRESLTPENPESSQLGNPQSDQSNHIRLVLNGSIAKTTDVRETAICVSSPDQQPTVATQTARCVSTSDQEVASSDFVKPEPTSPELSGVTSPDIVKTGLTSSESKDVASSDFNNSETTLSGFSSSPVRDELTSSGSAKPLTPPIEFTSSGLSSFTTSGFNNNLNSLARSYQRFIPTVCFYYIIRLFPTQHRKRGRLKDCLIVFHLEGSNVKFGSVDRFPMKLESRNRAT
jgi:hypothetical protein